jgi:hypothetical protein
MLKVGSWPMNQWVIESVDSSCSSPCFGHSVQKPQPESRSGREQAGKRLLDSGLKRLTASANSHGSTRINATEY